MGENDRPGQIVLQELPQQELTPAVLVGLHVTADGSEYRGPWAQAGKGSDCWPEDSLVGSALRRVCPALGGPSPRASPEAERPPYCRFILDEEALEHRFHTDRQNHSGLQGRETAPRTWSSTPVETLEPPRRLPCPDLRQLGGLREKTIEVHRLLPAAITSLGIPSGNEVPGDNGNVERGSFEDPVHQLIERLARSAHRRVPRVHCYDVPLRDRHDRVKRKKAQLCPEALFPDPLQRTRSAGEWRREAALDEKGDP